jgi:thiol-disulfide isomerase/thioredoxin
MKTVMCFVIIGFLLCTQTIFSQNIKSVKVTDIENIIEKSKAPLIINIWATWCQPCIEEIPYFIKEVDNYNTSLSSPTDSISLLLVSVDFKEAFPAEISSFANHRKFTAPIVWLDEIHADYFCPKIDPNWSGAIPATLFVNNKTGFRKFFEKKLSQEELKKVIMALLETN